MKTRITVGTMVFLIGLFIGWYGGLNYMDRGVMQAWALFSAAFFAIMAATFPGLGDK